MDRCAEILVVEDNPGDAVLLREAFSDLGSGVRLSFARDGLEALHYLRREEGFSRTAIPDLIVLDLKMPGMDGLTFLRVRRYDPELKDLAVVVLTGSDAPDDREAARALGARSFFTKPAKQEGWKALAEKLREHALTDRPD